MAKDYGFTREDAIAELKRRGVDTSEFERSAPTAPGDEPMAPLTPGADSRSRIALGLGPAVNAQRNIYATEGWMKPGAKNGGGENPYNKHPVATMLGNLDQSKIADWIGLSADPLAKVVGGQEYQDYEQANKSFESAFLPILSGAAVTPTEAQRMIRASLPELGDTRETLSRKATNRAMMINAAADLAGRPRPFPKAGTIDLAGDKPGSQPRAGQTAAPGVGPAAPKVGEIYKGHKYLGGDRANPKSWQKVQ